MFAALDVYVEECAAYPLEPALNEAVEPHCFVLFLLYRRGGVRALGHGRMILLAVLVRDACRVTDVLSEKESHNPVRSSPRLFPHCRSRR